MAVDTERLQGFLSRVVDDLGATMAAGCVVIGDRLGLYRALADPPLRRWRPQELATRTATAPRYVEEWLRAQAAGGYVEYDPTSDTYWLTEEQAAVLADPDGSLFAPGVFQLALSVLAAEAEIATAFRTGEGINQRRHDDGAPTNRGRLRRPGYGANLVSRWLPALTGVEAGLNSGIRVADIGCGSGAATVLMARAFPRSTFAGVDADGGSVERARDRATADGLAGRVRFDVASPQDFDGGPYDLITTLDSLHGLGDPLGAARRVRQQLAPGGTWMIVEPAAGSSVPENFNSVGRFYYSFSTFRCVPKALSEHGSYSLGAQAGEEPVRRLASCAGFRTFRQVARTPFNHVFEARP
jgi:2-polyprenyl-3-methyl-5-hydroxy-6-metoxy-1,4-benzoquinol methylase